MPVRPGRLTLPLAEKVGPDGEVTAIDIQDGMLHEARERAGKAGFTNIRFIRTGPGEGKLERNYFDRAVLATVFGEIPDQEVALQEIFEALRPGGILAHRRDYPGPSFSDTQYGQPADRCRGFCREGIFREPVFLYR